MEVRQLNTLIRAAQFQSFSKAAESLGYSQSAVTVQIKGAGRRAGRAPVRPHGQAGDPDRTGPVLVEEFGSMPTRRWSRQRSQR